MGTNIIRAMLLASVGVAMVVAAPVQAAAQETAYQIDIPAQPLGDALRSLGRVTRHNIVFDGSVVRGKRSVAVSGRMTASEALGRMLGGSGLVMTSGTGSTLTVKAGNGGSGSSTEEVATDHAEIVVTGSRIRGAVVTSPVITATGENIQKSGNNDLGSFIRSIPQNFSGGQNPTVAGGGSQGNNENTTSSSALNLRGLGADATLTLLNGHRLPYDGVFQGVDIAAIPLSAVERLEIVTDGASAIYGSDAVAGVANVILKRSFEGAETSVRVGASTDGGNEQLQLGVVGGAEWRSGGMMAVFDYSRQSAIRAGDRDYTRSLNATQTLVPKLDQYSAILTGHQSLGGAARLLVDGTYSHRESDIATPATVSADFLANGGLIRTELDSFSISPTLQIDVSDSWQFYLMGTYGESRAHLRNTFFMNGASYFDAWSDYNNKLETVEAGASGTLTPLPGGALKLAIGGGYRSNTLDLRTRSISGGIPRVSADFTRNRDSWYGFAELSAPIISPANQIPLLNQLAITAAARYEDYPGIDKVTTPKLGALYSPVSGVDLKLSWGRSFKAPTLYQEFQNKFVQLRLASAYGPSSLPTGSTVLQMSGGNPGALKPERSENLTLSAAFTPNFVPGARLELSYFRVRYRDRIRQPIASALGIFGNPIYAPFVTYAPTPAQIAAALADAPGGLSNFSGTTYDPTKVGAIIDNRQQNSARQNISGVDVSAKYSFSAASGTLTILADASYLKSTQILVAGQAETDLAGTIYNVPHWRARAGLTWEDAQLSAASYLNYVGGTQDRRATPQVAVSSLTTWDASLGYEIRTDKSFFDNTIISLSAINILNAEPDRIRQSFSIEPPYDSANYSPVGRFVSLSIRKHW